jgi:endonuclease/exonuclease/phosphatase family metal-dependent hydrolase
MERGRIMKHVHVFIMGFMLLWASLDVAAQPPGASARSIRFTRPIKVMTQNVYIGADINRVVLGTPAEIPLRVFETFQIILSTNYPERAQALADQIARFQPHLIGVQEAVRIFHQSPGDFLLGNPVEASDELFDYLDILLAALSERGLDYYVAAETGNADIELPTLALHGPPTLLLDDLRVIDRDVILARADVITTNSMAVNYAVNFGVPVPFPPFLLELTRSYASVHAEVNGETYRFVTTHLEEPLAELGLQGIQAAQAAELITALEDETLPVIAAGDFNSAPTDPFVPPYVQFVAAGYDDMWQRSPWGQHDAGLTCCQDEELFNDASAFDRRIDHILLKAPVQFLPAQAVGPTMTFVVGDREQDKTSSGLWPSDHAGVVARLRVPVPQP